MPAAGPPLRVRVRRAMPKLTSVTIVVVMLIVLFGPVLMLAVFSFNDSPIIALPWSGFTTHWYHEAWNIPEAKDAVMH